MKNVKEKLKRIFSLSTIVFFMFANTGWTAEKNLSWLSLLLAQKNHYTMTGNTNENNPFIAILSNNDNLERMGILADYSGAETRLTGIVCISPEGKSTEIEVDPITGLPSAMVTIDKQKLTFTNYTDDSVTLTLHSSEGAIIYGPVVQSVNAVDLESIKSQFSSINLSSIAIQKLILNKSGIISSEYEKTRNIIKWAGLAANLAGCIAGGISAIGTGGLLVPVGALFCTSAIFSTFAILEPSVFQTTAITLDAGSCAVGSIGSCIVLLGDLLLGLDEDNKGLVAYYKFDGNADDSSGNTNDGIEYGGVTYLVGKVGQTAIFDGSNDYVAVPNSDNISLPNITISTWIKLVKDIGATQVRIVNQQKNPVNSWGLEVFGAGYTGATGNNLVFHNGNGTGSINLVSPTNLSTNQWYHVVATNDGNTMRLFLNGELNASRASLGNNSSENISTITIGKSSTTGDNRFYFPGAIDDLRIYNKALTSAEVSTLYNSTK